MSKKDKKRPKGSLSKVKLAILVGIIVIAFASIAFFLLLQLTSTETAIENDGGQKDEKVVALERASKAAEEGDTTEVKKQYRTLIDAESDIERKTVMMIDWSGVLYAAGYHQEAIAVAKEAESLNEDRFLVADWLSRVYEYEKKYDCLHQRSFQRVYSCEYQSCEYPRKENYPNCSCCLNLWDQRQFECF